jgi:DNA-binding PucR family transcriptional regulator
MMALEHGATVLAVELARLRGLADTELRVRRELVHDLVTGTDDESAYLRADALRYDLGTPHRVLVAECGERSRAHEDFVHAVRRALRQRQVPCLLGTLSATVVVVTAQDTDWEALRQATVAELGGGRCRLSVGDPYPLPSQLPRSLREAQLALRLQKATSPEEKTSVFGELDVFRMLVSVDDLGDIERFAEKWLGKMIEYDRRRNTELVATLTQHLQHGGAYQATARALSVHRSTLKYRLQRIRELTGLDLTDPETHFNLALATRAWAALQALRG